MSTSDLNVKTRQFFLTSLPILILGLMFAFALPVEADTDVYILDTSFTQGTGFNGSVSKVVKTSDNKFVVVGDFSSYDSVTANAIVRLNSDGTIDNTFVTGTGFNSSNSINVFINNDNTLILTGNFDQYNSTPVGHIVKLNTDGSLNSAFMTNAGTGFNNRVIKSVVGDGGIIYSFGDFSAFNGNSSDHIGSVNADGTRNSTFNVGTGFDSNPSNINFYQHKVLVTGDGTYKGVPFSSNIYLDLDGTRNNSLPTFNSSGNLTNVLDGNGRNLVSGNFDTYNGSPISNFFRTNVDSMVVDNTFVQGDFEGGASAITFDSQDRIILANNSYSVEYSGVRYFTHTLTRLNTDGTIDTKFDVGYGFDSGENITTVVVADDGDIIVGGNFSHYYDGSVVSPSNYLMRLTRVPVSLGDVVTSDTGTVAFNNPNLFYSPYTWKDNTTSYETNDAGAYIKIAFTGPTLKLGLNRYGMQSVLLLSNLIHTYIDGATTPITNTLNEISDGVVTITTGLSSGSHYAIIYFSKSPNFGLAPNGASYNSFSEAAWNDPGLRLRVTHIQLANDGSGSVLSLAGTPIDPSRTKVLFFGDSVTLGSSDKISETGYAPKLAGLLGVEYGQVAFGSLGWNTVSEGGVPFFYNNTSPTLSSWRNYSSSSPRLIGGSLTGGFIGGAPDAVFVKMGTNDMIQSTDLTLVRTKIALFLADLRQATGPLTAIFFITPFRYPSETTWPDGFADYQALYPADDRVYLLNLGSLGNQIVVDNSPDFIHPNPVGSILIAQALEPLISPYVTDFVSSISSVTPIVNSDSATISWTSDGLGSSRAQYGLTSSYTNSTAESDLSPRVYDHQVTLSGLDACTTYHFEVTSEDSLGNVASSGDGTFTTAGCVTDILSTNRNISQRHYPNDCYDEFGRVYPVCTLPGLSSITTPPVVENIYKSISFWKDLHFGMKDTSVEDLQKFLNISNFTVAQTGPGSLGFETTFFGPATKAALIGFQKFYKITPAVGYFGPITRQVVNIIIKIGPFSGY